ncbi:Rap1-interacting factor 1 N-terminal [Penicillium alfredii]|uniref:Rap1-interacting factor 1 N-terminal n=1 Tax=Penicillium alfredii TaxID=1506179 RepID=A0A9W9F968_9EURO|nr:Rap1-interacting factor 1 N-terminal [Penicillium alfredii]KAJ5095975.1 Rap1-interacting factor 1 N-terminal [Penicillium alfredii]
MVEILGPLSARPPTPPRTASRIDENNPAESPLVQTPGGSPFSTVGSGAPPSSRSKRVNFSPWTNFIKPPTSTNPSKSASDLKSLPPSNERRPSKSILKATQSPIAVWSPNVDTFTAESLAMLLESVIQQLAGESISSRLDAYMQFFGALRTYEGLPMGQDIAEKLSLITDFIQRDVSRDLVNGGPLDTNLANQALKLSAAFVWHGDISTQLPEEFKIFLVDHSIICLQEAKVPKSVLTHYMSILSTQNFGPKIMTTARVTRLLSVLQDVTKQVTGNAIVSHRLSIYQRLLTQAKSTFVSQSALWMEHLISGLLNHLKDTRLKAISLGFQTSTAAGPNPVLSKTIRDLFDRPLENDRKLITEIRERMSRMMASTESGAHVPQVWSIIILLLRSKRWNLGQWEHFKEWVLVLQKCFNCSEPAIKAQAILGWNRFVFAINPNESTSPSLLKMLGKPILSQFERKKSDKSGSSPTHLALGSYYNLLYYAFRPSAPFQHLDVVWEEYVATPSNIFSSAPALSDCVFRVLANLLWSSQAKLWTENRNNDPTRLEAEELPSIDSRWVRSRIPSVFKVFEALLKSSVWNPTVEKSNVALAWNSLSSALSFASSKEITPSGESMQAVASALGLLSRLCLAGPSSLNATGDNCADIFFERFRFLSKTVIISLGSIPFTEKLVLRTADNTFQTVNTPSNRHPHMDINLDSPALHLLRALGSITWTTTPTPSFTNLVASTIEASCNGRISRGSRLELLQQCADLCTGDMESLPRTPQLSEVVWKATAQATADALRSFPSESARERDGSVFRDYENVIKILSSGLGFPTAFLEWSRLLESFVRVVRTEKGNRALATMIVEPMAECLMRLPAYDTLLPSTSLFGHSLSIPFFLGSEFGSESDNAQPADPSLFPHKFLGSIGRTLRGAYDDFDASETHALADFIESLTSFLGSGVPSFRCQVLETLQPPLGLWLKDDVCKVDADHNVDSRVLTACRALSSAILNILQTSVSHDLSSLQRFEVIMCAGLESSHISSIKRFVELWGTTFGSHSSLAYADTVVQALQKAESKLQGPALPLQSDVQDTDMLPPGSQEQLHRPVNELSGSSVEISQAANLNSSPVVKAKGSTVLELPVQPNEPQLPTTLQLEGHEAQSAEKIPRNSSRSKRREVFKMIDSIQSSSPANSPRGLGFHTPPHLRKLQSLEPGVPLTPTLVPAENEEQFFGSSPTPGTRDPTPAANSNVPPLTSHDITRPEADPPSSPPEIHSRSPSPRKRSKRSRSERRRSAKARRALAGDVGQQEPVSSPAISEHAEANAETPRAGTDKQAQQSANTSFPADERPPSRSLRSVSGKDAAANPEPSTQTAAAEMSGNQLVQTPRSSSKSKKKKKKNVSKSAAQMNQQPTENVQLAPVNAVPEYHVDSSSEDLETQIASQLEQDLELAVDMDDRTYRSKPIGFPPPETVTKKRKREEDEARSASTKDRRRSTRLSSTKDLALAATDTQESEAVQLQASAVSDLAQDTSSAKSSSVAPRRLTRSSQHKENESTLGDSMPQAQDTDSAQEPPKDSEASRPPSKRLRKSSRLDAPSAPVSAEEDPGESKSSCDTRSRKGRSRKSARQNETALSQPEEPPSQAELPATQDGDLDVVPESIIAEEKPAELNVPLISTEEATDSQMTDIAPSNEADSVNPDIQMDMDYTDMDKQPDGEVANHVPSVATMATQTEGPAPPEPTADRSEAGITQSLQKLLGDMKDATLGPSALREVDDLLFNIRVAAHDASRRHNTSA